MEPKDCRIIDGDAAAIISRSTAEYALDAMRKAFPPSRIDNLPTDDKSFVIVAFQELENAVK